MIRKGNEFDLTQLEKMARRVANDLHSLGIDQWSDTYPGIENFRSDLTSGSLYVLIENELLVGSITIRFDVDALYDVLTWKKSRSAVIHRLMVEPKRMREGFGAKLMEFAIDLIRKAGCESIKVDTHPDNFRMKNLLRRFGFLPTGYLASIHRDAFELVLEE
jgi:ribosomal protein S18 acetylase RimI-like enzyme